jgi:hypothetical protein
MTERPYFDEYSGSERTSSDPAAATAALASIPHGSAMRGWESWPTKACPGAPAAISRHCG